MDNATEVKNRLIQWIQEYFKENARKDTMAVIGISGGKDSSVVASLCVEALGVDRVIGVLMPNGIQKDIDSALQLVKHLGIKNMTINIEDSLSALYNSLTASKEIINEQVTINTPARLRMTTLYMVAGSLGGRVANTCNLSESYVGYSTKFGDNAGDFSPLGNLTVNEVKQIGYELNLPRELIEKIPEDGLSNETDEDRFGFTYKALDKYIRSGICDSLETKEKIDKMHKMSRHKKMDMPTFTI